LDDYSKQILNFLSPDSLKENLIFTSIFIAIYENFKHTIVENLKFFYCNGFDEKGYFFPSYEEEVLNKITSTKNREIRATLDWFKEHEVINDKDIATFKKITNLRNEFAHNTLNVLITGLPDKSKELFEQMISLFEKITRWWIQEIEIPINSEMTEKEYNDLYLDEVTSLNIVFLKMMSDIAQNNTEEYLELYKSVQTIMKDKNNE